MIVAAASRVGLNIASSESRKMLNRSPHGGAFLLEQWRCEAAGQPDHPRSRRSRPVAAFYEALGWETGAEPGDDVVFFQAGDMVLALWDRARLAEDSCVEDGGGWGGTTLALNFGSREEVDAPSRRPAPPGAEIGREPAETFWGGYSGVFLDPDGHPWEIAHNPHWTVTEDGGVQLG